MYNNVSDLLPQKDGLKEVYFLNFLNIKFDHNVQHYILYFYYNLENPPPAFGTNKYLLPVFC